MQFMYVYKVYDDILGTGYEVCSINITLLGALQGIPLHYGQVE